MHIQINMCGYVCRHLKVTRQFVDVLSPVDTPLLFTSIDLSQVKRHNDFFVDENKPVRDKAMMHHVGPSLCLTAH